MLFHSAPSHTLAQAGHQPVSHTHRKYKLHQPQSSQTSGAWHECAAQHCIVAAAQVFEGQIYNGWQIESTHLTNPILRTIALEWQRNGSNEEDAFNQGLIGINVWE